MLKVPSGCKVILEPLSDHLMMGVGKPSAEHVNSTVSMATAMVTLAGAAVSTGCSGREKERERGKTYTHTYIHEYT